MASPGPLQPSNASKGTRALTEAELQRKRARDRKAQQAMRDRNKFTLQSQSAHINYLNDALAIETERTHRLNDRVQDLETRVADLEAENESLRDQNGALRMMGIRGDGVNDKGVLAPNGRFPWEVVPRNNRPIYPADRILQNVVEQVRRQRKASTVSPRGSLHEVHASCKVYLEESKFMS
jgi:hypothetical protein